jgi:hypothetical protein
MSRCSRVDDTPAAAGVASPLRSTSATPEQAHIEPTQHHSSRYPSWQNRLMPSSPRGPDSPEPTLQRSTTSSPTPLPSSALPVEPTSLHPQHHPGRPAPSASPTSSPAPTLGRSAGPPSASTPAAEQSAHGDLAANRGERGPQSIMGRRPRRRCRGPLASTTPRPPPASHRRSLPRVQYLNRRTSSRPTTTRVDTRPGRTASGQVAHDGQPRPSRHRNAAPPRRPRSFPLVSSAVEPTSLHPQHHPGRPAPLLRRTRTSIPAPRIAPPPKNLHRTDRPRRAYHPGVPSAGVPAHPMSLPIHHRWRSTITPTSP